MYMNETTVQALNGLYGQSMIIDGLIVFGSEILPYMLVVMLIVWVFMSKDRKTTIKQVTMILFAAFVAVAMAEMLKYWFNSPRPFMVLDGVRGVLENDPYGSFPSSHMTFFTALAVALFRKNITLSGMFFAGVLIIGVSRIAAGVHFPIDIIAGFTLGIIVSCIVGYAEKRYRQQYSIKSKLLFWKK